MLGFSEDRIGRYEFVINLANLFLRWHDIAQMLCGMVGGIVSEIEESGRWSRSISFVHEIVTFQSGENHARGHDGSSPAGCASPRGGAQPIEHTSSYVLMNDISSIS